MERANSNPEKQKQRDTEDFEPIGGLYDDKRDHGSAGTQRADEGTQERDENGNIGPRAAPNAGGSPSRSHSSDGDEAAGVGNQ